MFQTSKGMNQKEMTWTNEGDIHRNENQQGYELLEEKDLDADVNKHMGYKDQNQQRQDPIRTKIIKDMNLQK